MHSRSLFRTPMRPESRHQTWHSGSRWKQSHPPAFAVQENKAAAPFSHSSCLLSLLHMHQCTLHPPHTCRWGSTSCFRCWQLWDVLSLRCFHGVLISILFSPGPGWNGATCGFTACCNERPSHDSMIKMHHSKEAWALQSCLQKGARMVCWHKDLWNLHHKQRWVCQSTRTFWGRQKSHCLIHFPLHTGSQKLVTSTISSCLFVLGSRNQFTLVPTISPCQRQQNTAPNIPHKARCCYKCHCALQRTLA